MPELIKKNPEVSVPSSADEREDKVVIDAKFEVVGVTPEETADRIVDSARAEVDAFASSTEGVVDLTGEAKKDLITKAETAAADLESEVKKIETSVEEPDRADVAIEKNEKKEHSREEILESFDESLATLKKEFSLLSPGQRQSPQGKELAWVIESAQSAKTNSVDQGKSALTVEILDEHGTKVREQQEGIPVDGVLKFLDLYERQLKTMSVPEDKKTRLQQLESIIAENEALRASGGVVSENVEAFQRKNIAERDAILALAEKDPEYIRAKQIHQTLEDASVPYFQAHFGKPSSELTPEEQRMQHLRTQTEAKYISLDYRSTGNNETDYQAAMEAMKNRRELQLPEEVRPDEVETPIEDKAPDATEVPAVSDISDVPEKTSEPVVDEVIPKVPEVPREVEREKVGPSIDFLRNAYAVAVNGRKKFFGRTSDVYVDQAREAYEAALQEKFQDQLKNEFAGLDIKDEKVLEQYFARQTELLVGGLKERELLVDAMNETQEKSAGKKFKDFWKRHTKLRMAIGAGLTAGAFISGATGNIPVMAALLAGRVAMSGVGTTMTVEAAWEGVRQRYGKTGEMKEQKISEMTDEQLEEYYAAQSVGAADRNLKRDQKISFFGKKTDSKTAELVKAEIQERRRIALRQEAIKLKEEGKSNEEIIESSLSSLLASEKEGHAQLEDRTDWLRRNNMKKWVTAIVAGAAMAAFVGVRGVNQIRDAIEAKGVPTPTPTEAEPTEPPAETPPAVAGPAEVPPTEVGATTPDVPASSIDGVETVGKGDSVWKLIDHQLEKRLNSYGSLSEAQKTHLIDQFKDRVADDPKSFGLDNIDNLKVGQKVDLSSLFEGQDKIGQALEHTKDLSESQLENISHNNGVLREWVMGHPNERLTSDMVEKILHPDQSVDAVADTTQAATATVKGGQSFVNPSNWKFDGPEPSTGLGSKVGLDAGQQGNGMDSLGDQLREQVKTGPALDQGAINPETLVPPKELLKLTDRFDIAAPTETHIVIEHADKVMTNIGKTTDALPESTLRRLTDISVGDFVKRTKGVAKSLATMEGFTEKSANAFVKNVKKLITEYADKAGSGKVDREWTLGELSKVVTVAEKVKK